MVQVSSANAVRCLDVNKDGYLDLVMGGNEFGFLPQFGRLDASFGHVLLNNGKGQFAWQNFEQSGLQLSGQIRDIEQVNGKDMLYLLFLRNDDYPALYQVNSRIKK